jgi:queuine/archaeosine tRNA-ribosyltransferase
MLGSSYLTLHNISHYLKLMQDLREAINNNTYDESAEMLLNRYKIGDIEIYN